MDAVIAWVDGSDPNHFKKRIQRQKELNLPTSENLDPSRYSSNYEINYCVLSLLKFAPFFNHIYIVTDHQKPDIFEDVEKNFPGASKKITIVDHRDIFPDFLPNFNSLSIATNLYKIKGLDDRFVYFNDDIFLIKPAKESDFFKGERPVLRGSWEINSDYRKGWNAIRKGIYTLFGRAYQPRVSFHLTQWQAARLIGFKLKYWSNSHTPHPMNKSVLEKYFEEHPKIYQENIRHPFRVTSQFSSIALNNHIEILKFKNNIRDSIRAIYFKHRPEPNYTFKKIAEIKNSDNDQLFLCVQNLDELDTSESEALYATLDKIIAPVERKK